jgi:hypothetical protein
LMFCMVLEHSAHVRPRCPLHAITRASHDEQEACWAQCRSSPAGDVRPHLRAARKRRRMTRADVAERVGVSERTCWRYEKARMQPSSGWWPRRSSTAAAGGYSPITPRSSRSFATDRTRPCRRSVSSSSATELGGFFSAAACCTTMLATAPGARSMMPSTK